MPLATTPSAPFDRTDGQLFAAVVGGDVDAYHQLFDRYASSLRRFLSARVGPDSAEDLVVETFAVAWTRRGSFDQGAESARPWLYGIAAKLVRRHLTLETRWQNAVTAATHSANHVDDGDRPARGIDPALAAAIAGLDVREREMLLLVALGELKVAEAARAIGITPVAARLRLLRARRRIVADLRGATDE